MVPSLAILYNGWKHWVTYCIHPMDISPLSHAEPCSPRPGLVKISGLKLTLNQLEQLVPATARNRAHTSKSEAGHQKLAVKLLGVENDSPHIGENGTPFGGTTACSLSLFVFRHLHVHYIR